MTDYTFWLGRMTEDDIREEYFRANPMFTYDPECWDELEVIEIHPVVSSVAPVSR